MLKTAALLNYNKEKYIWTTRNCLTFTAHLAGCEISHPMLQTCPHLDYTSRVLGFFFFYTMLGYFWNNKSEMLSELASSAKEKKDRLFQTFRTHLRSTCAVLEIWQICSSVKTWPESECLISPVYCTALALLYATKISITGNAYFCFVIRHVSYQDTTITEFEICVLLCP